MKRSPWTYYIGLALILTGTICSVLLGIRIWNIAFAIAGIIGVLRSDKPLWLRLVTALVLPLAVAVLLTLWLSSGF